MNIDKAQNTASFTTAEMPRKRGKRIRIKPNKEGMLALLALILITAIIITACVFAIKGIIMVVNKNNDETTTNDPNNGQNTLPWNSAYTTTPWSSANVIKGELLLVNSQNVYSLADALKERGSTDLYGYEGHGTYYVLPGTGIKVNNIALPYLKQMLFDMVDANPNTLGTANGQDKLYIESAYRDFATQEDKNTSNPTRYPELAGYSEHHTGLAFDLKVQSNGAYISMRDAEYQWLEANCAKYGFVFRYADNKVSLTGMNEPSHLRYVGVAHATYMVENDLCLEEYLELLRNSHKYEQTPLEVTANEKEYLVYYVAANTAEGENFTAIPVPPASEGTYSISGDNMNGFIVTVEKAAN